MKKLLLVSSLCLFTKLSFAGAGYFCADGDTKPSDIRGRIPYVEIQVDENLGPASNPREKVQLTINSNYDSHVIKSGVVTADLISEESAARVYKENKSESIYLIDATNGDAVLIYKNTKFTCDNLDVLRKTK